MIEVKPLPERREQDRLSLSRPVKIFDPKANRYIPGCTTNVSQSGALLNIPQPLLIKPGDTVYVGIALKRREGLLLSNEMIEAQVVRCLATEDDQTHLAVRFAVPAEDAVTQARLAA